MTADSGKSSTLAPRIESASGTLKNQITEKEAVNGMFGEDFWSELTSQSFPKAVPNNTPSPTISQLSQETASAPKLDRWEIYKNWLISQVDASLPPSDFTVALMKVYELEGKNFSDVAEMEEYHKYLELKDKFEKN